jgi:hypothetical protein
VKQLTWPAVGLIAVLGGIAVALATVAHWDPAAILGVLGILGGIGGGAAVAGGVNSRVEEVAGRLNGELDGRIVAAVRQGNAEQLATILREFNRGES